MNPLSEGGVELAQPPPARKSSGRGQHGNRWSDHRKGPKRGGSDNLSVDEINFDLESPPPSPPPELDREFAAAQAAQGGGWAGMAGQVSQQVARFDVDDEGFAAAPTPGGSPHAAARQGQGQRGPAPVGRGHMRAPPPQLPQLDQPEAGAGRGGGGRGRTGRMAPPPLEFATPPPPNTPPPRIPEYSAPDPLPTGQEMGLEFTSDDFLAVIDEMTFEELKDSCDELGATLPLCYWLPQSLRQGSRSCFAVVPRWTLPSFARRPS